MLRPNKINLVSCSRKYLLLESQTVNQQRNILPKTNHFLINSFQDTFCAAHTTPKLNSAQSQLFLYLTRPDLNYSAQSLTLVKHSALRFHFETLLTLSVIPPCCSRSNKLSFTSSTNFSHRLSRT